MAKLLRGQDLSEKTGQGKSKNALDIKAGLLPKPIRRGGMSFWVDDEIDEILELRIAGGTDDEIRELVIELVARRPQRAQRAAA